MCTHQVESDLTTKESNAVCEFQLQVIIRKHNTIIAKCELPNIKQYNEWSDREQSNTKQVDTTIVFRKKIHHVEKRRKSYFHLMGGSNANI